MIASAVIAYGAHYGVTKLYSNICVPDGVYGFLQGSITTGSPVCSMLFTIMTNTNVTYSTLLTISITRIVVDVFNSFQYKDLESKKEEKIPNA